MRHSNLPFALSVEIFLDLVILALNSPRILFTV